MKLEHVDSGKSFDWSKSSEYYAKYRDIYPKEFYQILMALGIGQKGQKILDLGTGTGVLPRNMYDCGAEFTGMDIAEGQIEQAKLLSREKEMNISYVVGGAEELPFSDNEFDVVTAITCWQYFDKSKAIPEIKRVLKDKGELLIAFMSWLPEDNIVNHSINLVKKFNPSWKGYNKRTSMFIPEWAKGNFRMTTFHAADIKVPFNYESWNGRMVASRGISASLSPEEVERFSNEHIEMLKGLTEDSFELLHEIVFLKFDRKF
jgi:SAM-dependent methyltransferase